MYSITRLIRGAAARGVLIAALLLLSAPIARAHNTDLNKLEIQGPWSKDCPTMDKSAFFKDDATMRQAVNLAWSMSHEGGDEHEVGFIAYQERRRTKDGYEYRTVIKNAKAGPTGGGGATVNLLPPIKTGRLRPVMIFHTHPGPEGEIGGDKYENADASPHDIYGAMRLGIPSSLIWGSGPTWHDQDYILFGVSLKDQRSHEVTSKTPGAKEWEPDKWGESFWFVDITIPIEKWWSWRCKNKSVKVTGDAQSWLGNNDASGNRLTTRIIRGGEDGLETVEAPHPAVAAPQLPDIAGLEQAMSMAGQSMAPEQLAEMEEAIKGAMANPTVALAMNSGWEDRERVEFIPLEDEPVVCSASLEKTYPSFMSGGQDQVTGVSSVKTTFTPLPEAESGFAFVTVQEIRANTMGRIQTNGPMTMARSKAQAGARAVVNGTIELEYSQAASLDLDLSLSQQAGLSSPDPAMIKPPLEPGVDLYWEATAMVADQDGRMVERLRFPRLTCPVNSQVAETWSLSLPLPPEGQTYTVTLDCSQQGGNYTVVGPATVPGGWTTARVTIKGQASASLAEPQGEPELEPEARTSFPVS